MEKNDKHTIFCTSCGMEFDDMLPECPACGTMNYKGAEAEYLRQLQDVRADMDELQKVPEMEMKREMKKQWAFLKKMLVIIVIVGGLFFGLIIGMNVYEDYRYEQDLKYSLAWVEAHEQEFEALDREGKYDEMMRLYETLTEERSVVISWKYQDFLYVYNEVLLCQDIVSDERERGKLSKYYYDILLSSQWYLLHIEEKDNLQLTSAQKAFIAQETVAIRQDFDKRWHMSGDTLAEFEEIGRKNYGYVPYTKFEDYVETWYKENVE